MLLTGASLGASLFGVFVCLRGGRATHSWTLTFATITVFVGVAWFTIAPWGGPLAILLWLLLVGAPMAALRRSVRAITLENYDDAERWAAWAARLHPSTGGRLQVPLTRLMRRLDDGDLEVGLAELQAIHEEHPELGAWCPADEMRFAGDWEGVRAWMEEELTEEERYGQVRHALPYLLSLAETGDAAALVTAYEHSGPGLARLRGWGLHERAQLVVAVTCGLREHDTRLLSGPLAELPEPSRRLVLATLKMAEGDVEAGRQELRALRPTTTFANQLTIDRRMRLDPARVSNTLRERARALLSATSVVTRPSRWKRVVSVVAVMMVIALVAIVWAPWRDTAPRGIDGDPLRYIERIAAGADVDDALPMLIVLHGYGSVPEEMHGLYGGLTTPTRVIIPAGPLGAGIGRAWFEDDLSDFDDASLRVAHFADTMSDERPTLGTPIITGFSQGGMLSFAVAVQHPDTVAAAFPVAGFLDDDQQLRRAPTPHAPPIHAFHGELDPLISIAAARDTTRRLRALGFDVTLSPYAGLEHTINDALARDLYKALDEALAAQAAIR